MQYLADLMQSLGALELFITSDGQNDMKPSSDMAPNNGEGKKVREREREALLLRCY